MTGCRGAPGAAECVGGRCVCAPKRCATAAGTCEAARGKWIGEYAVRFLKPRQPARQYLGAGGPGLKVTSDSAPAWKIALTATGHVRLESARAPGEVLTIYENRRRRTEKSTSSAFFEVGRISDDDDLWPRVQPLETVSPLEASFQVRRKGDGVEIWDPHRQVAIAGADTEGWAKDGVSDQGVAECRPDLFGMGCDGRQVVAFAPELPPEAVSSKGNIRLGELGELDWWLELLVILCLVGVLGACCLCVCISVCGVKRERARSASLSSSA